MDYAPHSLCSLKIGNETIERIGLRFKTKSFKLVGIHLDDMMRWGEHAAKVRSKIATSSYAIARIKKSVPLQIKLQIYNSLLKCHLEYCLPIWGSCPNNIRRSILTIQKQTLRNIKMAKYNSHTDPIFKKLKILKFNDLYTLTCATFMFQIALGTHPSTINNLFVKSKNFDRNCEFLLKYANNNFLSKQLHSTLVIIWNRLPAGIKGWLKELPEGTKSNKSVFSKPTKILQGHNNSHNKFRLKGCQNALTDYFIHSYSEVVKCNNKFCYDCKVPK